MALATDLNLNLSSSLPAAIKVDKIPDSFVLTSRTANEAVWTDTNTPVDRPRRVRLAFNPIANVYRGSGIDPGFQYPSKRGVSALIQSTSVASVEDGENGCPHRSTDLVAHRSPVSGHQLFVGDRPRSMPSSSSDSCCVLRGYFRPRCRAAAT